MTPLLAEFIGTATLMLLGAGVVANVLLNKTNGNNSGWIVITAAWAFAVFVGVTIASPYSGAHLNCAVTLSVFMMGGLDLATTLAYMLAQIAGAMTGAFLVWAIYKDHFDQTPDAAAKQAVFCTAPAIKNISRNLLTECIGTFVLIFAILNFQQASLGAKTPIDLGAIGALPVSILVWAIGLSLGGTTGYAINPARDLGPRIIHALVPIKDKAPFNPGYAWVPILGPFLGSAAATALYILLN